MMSMKEIRSDLRKQLNARRCAHTISVMYTAASLAMCHGEDVQKALVAGLLHDCTKDMTDQEHMALCERAGEHLSPSEQENRHLLHAPTGAIAAREKYGVEDEDILNAIRSHTTGRAGMSLLEKIIFTADYIEPVRKGLPGIDEVRFLAFHDLDKCVHTISNNTLKYLNNIHASIDPRTKETCQYYYKEDK